jgi:hypothetical protein
LSFVLGCHLFAWKRTVDLVWKPQCGHPHSLFVTNFNIFSPLFSLSVYWRLSKLHSSVFYLVITPWACVSFSHHSMSLCFLSFTNSIANPFFSCQQLLRWLSWAKKEVHCSKLFQKQKGVHLC